MNWPKGSMLRWIAMALVATILSGCGGPYDPLYHSEYERQRREDRAFERGVILEIYLQYLKCQEPGTIRFDGTCVSSTTTQAIYDHSTGQPLNATTATVGTQLECRDPGRAGLAAAVGNAWYVSKIPNPPLGYEVTWVQNQGVIYDSSGNVTGVNAFTSFVSGDLLYCLVRHNDSYAMYQSLLIQ